ncbi:MAG TPA: amidohydrolase family protein [Microthrixaceae bacterium]|nr:amidohydrolase family protein [Microthrixaceae bacterium]
MLDTVIRGGTIVDGTGAEAFTGDVGVREGHIVAIGTVDEAAREEIEADGALVTPGFLDLHTHYDGQVTWDEGLEPSATNGITTVVLGNCGVGFAPVRPADHEQLIDMMEGVEDIPGAALTDGMPWGQWETFAEYLDVLDARRYAADVACHIAHGPVRYYVMGERAYEDHDATPDEVAAMAGIVREAFDAGAAGFSSNRFRAHMSRSGRIVPGTFAPREEIGALAAAAGQAGHGVIQAIADGTITPGAETDEMPELDLLASLSIGSGRPLTFSTFQASKESGVFRRVLDGTGAWNARGAQLRPQIIPRAVTFMTSLASYHPFMNRPTYKSLADLPVAEQAARMRVPEMRDQILGEQDEFTGGLGAMMGVMLGRAVGRLFSLAFPVDYEPDPSQSVKALARAEGVEPLEFLYDRMTEGDGTTFFALLGNNFDQGTLEPCREMLLDPHSVSGLSDAGAHVMMISDCSSSTFHLTHWVRDRTKGDRVPLEVAVNKLTGAPAEMYGFADRGVVGVGRRADLNIIDFDNLTIQAPYTRADLPTGARRILQPSTGYLATMVRGEVVRRDDQDTGVRPGRLVRSRRGGN